MLPSDRSLLNELLLKVLVVIMTSLFLAVNFWVISSDWADWIQFLKTPIIILNIIMIIVVLILVIVWVCGFVIVAYCLWTIEIVLRSF